MIEQATPRKTQKPVRVTTAEVEVFRCPVCRDLVHGTVEVAVHLGEVTMQQMVEEDGDTITMEATAAASTEMRGLRVNHQCSRDAQAVEG